jgi:hypothetical protein
MRLAFSGVADIRPAEGALVYGGLWRISAADLRSLDSYEGFPDFYGRQTVQVLTEGGPQSALTYVMSRSADRYIGAPSAGYLRTIAAGYAYFGLPRQALADAVRETYAELQEAGVSRLVPDGPKRRRAARPAT